MAHRLAPRLAALMRAHSASDAADAERQRRARAIVLALREMNRACALPDVPVGPGDVARYNRILARMRALDGVEPAPEAPSITPMTDAAAQLDALLTTPAKNSP